MLPPTRSHSASPNNQSFHHHRLLLSLLLLVLFPSTESWQSRLTAARSPLFRQQQQQQQHRRVWRILPTCRRRPSQLSEQPSNKGQSEDDNDQDLSSSSSSLTPPTSKRKRIRRTVSNLFNRNNNNNNGVSALEASSTADVMMPPEEMLDELETENSLLRETIRQLELENDRLSSQQRVVLETFEGEGRYAAANNRGKDYGGANNSTSFGGGMMMEADMMNFGITLTGEELTGDVTTAGWSEEEAALWCDALEADEDSCPVEPTVSFGSALRDRAYWLVGLLVMQSCSGLILSRNEALLANHPIIIYFLTMLVGAGGNAGNQASVRVIRGIALGTLNERTQGQFLNREFKMAAALSTILSLAGFLRAAAFRTPFPETVAVTASLALIVFTSICLGAILPLLLQKLGVDPAHSSTTIQVVMDILGVFVAVAISGLILDSPLGLIIINRLGG